MRDLRTYFSAEIRNFLSMREETVLGIIHSNDISAKTTIQQSNAWREEVSILKKQLRGFCVGRIIFEYTIPRMGKRVDAVLLYKNIVFLLEFKCGEREYRKADADQVLDYALDLRNFQKMSHDKLIIPILIATRASDTCARLKIYDKIAEPLKCASDSLGAIIKTVAAGFSEPDFDYIAWGKL